MVAGDLHAIAAADEVIARLPDPPGPAEREELSAAMRSRARALERLERTEEAIAAFGALAARFADAREATLRGRAARALFNEAWLLAGSGRHEEAIARYDAFLGRFADDTEAISDRWVAKALRTLGLDRWAADHGHPLDLTPSDDEPDFELPSPGELPGGVEGFPAAFALAVRTADVVAAARRAPAAAELLAAADLRDRAADAVARAVNWAAWLGQRRPEAAPAGVAMLLLAQGVFAATWSADPARRGCRHGISSARRSRRPMSTNGSRRRASCWSG